MGRRVREFLSLQEQYSFSIFSEQSSSKIRKKLFESLTTSEAVHSFLQKYIRFTHYLRRVRD